MFHAAFLRSPHPHAGIVSVDVAKARRSPGVVAVYTGAEMKAKTNPFVNLGMLAGLYSPVFWPLASDRVRRVGHPAALVIASSRAEAEDALEHIDVKYRLLRPVGTIATALGAGSELLWPKNGGNAVYEHTDTFGDLDSVFASADHVLTERFSSHRQSNQPMETRGCVAEVAPKDWSSIPRRSRRIPSWILAFGTSRAGTVDTPESAQGRSRSPEVVGKGAKEVLTANKDELSKSDNVATIYQVRPGPSTLRHIGRLFSNTLAMQARHLPRVVAGDIGGASGAYPAVPFGAPLFKRIMRVMMPGTYRPEAFELTSAVSYDGGRGGWVHATHVCFVEIDPDTGMVSILRYMVVEDCGDLINPAVFDGQIRGGVGQGVGAVFYEKVDHDVDANSQSSTFVDYLIPTAMGIPTVEIHHVQTPTEKPANFCGVGEGEGGVIGAPASDHQCDRRRSGPSPGHCDGAVPAADAYSRTDGCHRPIGVAGANPIGRPRWFFSGAQVRRRQPFEGRPPSVTP